MQIGEAGTGEERPSSEAKTSQDVELKERPVPVTAVRDVRKLSRRSLCEWQSGMSENKQRFTQSTDHLGFHGELLRDSRHEEDFVSVSFRFFFPPPEYL